MVRCHWETHGLPGTKVTWEYYLESAEEPVPKAYRHNLLECEFDTAADQARFAQIWKDQIGKTPVFMTVMSAPEASMANSFGRDILIQAEDAEAAARFYVEQLGFRVTDPNPKMIGLSGPNITLYIEPGPALGPVLEVFVDDVEAAKRRLVEAGATIIKDEPAVPRVYLRDPQGLIYNLAKKS
jgi:predicted enzyme related to lactoylglutathione lyase